MLFFCQYTQLSSSTQLIWPYKFSLMKMKYVLTLSREISKSYGSKSVKFEPKIMKKIPKDIENGIQIKPLSTFLGQVNTQ